MIQNGRSIRLSRVLKHATSEPVLRLGAQRQNHDWVEMVFSKLCASGEFVFQPLL